MFYDKLPLRLVLLPISALDSIVELDVSGEIPLLHRPLKVVQNFLTTRVEVAPFRVWVKWECLITMSAQYEF